MSSEMSVADEVDKKDLMTSV